jgi:GDP-4-dehydro-6-deoxy-D-mannose reductase
MRVLITGATGLIGSHLAEYLLSQGDCQVFGFKRWRAPTARLGELAERIGWIEGDIEDPYSVQRAVELAAPQRVFHLAAQSYPGESWDSPQATITVNVIGTLHLLESVRRLRPDCQVLIACSSAQYGLIKAEDVPVSEEHPLRPANPYGVSKVAQESLGLQYHLSYGLRVYLARFFNQVGTRQDERCSIQSFAQQIAELERRPGGGALRHGNLEPKRDFLDVRDGVRAICGLVERGEPGRPYNVCSGVGRTMREVLRELLDLGRATIRTEVDAQRLRPVDEPVLVGDPTRLTTEAGWLPTVPFAQTLADILQYWRSQLAAGPQGSGVQ